MTLCTGVSLYDPSTPVTDLAPYKVYVTRDHENQAAIDHLVTTILQQHRYASKVVMVSIACLMNYTIEHMVAIFGCEYNLLTFRIYV